MHTDPGWWLVWMGYGVLMTIIVGAVIRRINANDVSPCPHNRLRFHTHTNGSSTSTWYAVCLDCGVTDVDVKLVSVNKENREEVLSDVMQARGYDQDPIETTRWSKA